MTAYNRNFDLDVGEMELIETALHDKVRYLTKQREALGADASEDLDAEIHHYKSVLGRLHNQKVFYRPRKGIYVGG